VKKKIGIGLIIAGVALEGISLLSQKQVVASDANTAQMQATLVNLNGSLGSIHLSYVMIGAGVWLTYF
jgi:hypothetical protein